MGFLSEDINQDHEPILHVHVTNKKYYPDVKSLTKVYYELCSKRHFFLNTWKISKMTSC